MFYAQLNEDNVCIGISELTKEVPEYNYITEVEFDPISGESTETERFVSRMVQIPVYSPNYMGLVYNDGKWEKIE